MKEKETLPQDLSDMFATRWSMWMCGVNLKFPDIVCEGKKLSIFSVCRREVAKWYQSGSSFSSIVCLDETAKERQHVLDRKIVDIAGKFLINEQIKQVDRPTVMKIQRDFRDFCTRESNYLEDEMNLDYEHREEYYYFTRLHEAILLKAMVKFDNFLNE